MFFIFLIVPALLTYKNTLRRWRLDNNENCRAIKNYVLSLSSFLRSSRIRIRFAILTTGVAMWQSVEIKSFGLLSLS